MINQNCPILCRTLHICGESLWHTVSRKCQDKKILVYTFTGDSEMAEYLPILLLTIHHHELLKECWEDVKLIDNSFGGLFSDPSICGWWFSEPIICRGDNAAIILTFGKDFVRFKPDFRRASKMFTYFENKVCSHQERASLFIVESDFCSHCNQSCFLEEGQTCEISSNFHHREESDERKTLKPRFYLPRNGLDGNELLKTGQLSGPFKRELRKLYVKLFHRIDLEEDGIQVFNCESFRKVLFRE